MWITQFTHGYPSAAGPVQTSESLPVRDRRSTTEPPNQLAKFISKLDAGHSIECKLTLATQSPEMFLHFRDPVSVILNFDLILIRIPSYPFKIRSECQDMLIPVASLVTVVAAVLVLSCGQTDADERITPTTLVSLSNHDR